MLLSISARNIARTAGASTTESPVGHDALSAYAGACTVALAACTVQFMPPVRALTHIVPDSYTVTTHVVFVWQAAAEVLLGVLSGHHCHAAAVTLPFVELATNVTGVPRATESGVAVNDSWAAMISTRTVCAPPVAITHGPSQQSLVEMSVGC